MEKEFLINGPVNLVRLEKGRKIIYIYGDIHNNILNESSCPISNIENIDIQQFIIRQIKRHPKINFNVFIEMYDDFNSNTNSISNYLEEVRKLINVDLPNLSIHSIDNRNNILTAEEIEIIYYNSFELNYNELTFNYIEKTYYFIEKYTSMLKKIRNYLSDTKSILQNDSEQIISMIQQLIQTLTKNIDLLNKKYLSFDERRNLTIEISKYIFDIEMSVRILLANVVDQNIISKLTSDNSFTICYVGLAHLINISHYLVNKFDFKITNIVKGKPEINQELKNLPISFQLETFYYLKHLFEVDSTSIQCLNVSSFPKDLL